MQVAWTPTNVKLGELLGFVAYNDLPGLSGVLPFNQATLNGPVDLEHVTTLTGVSFPNLTSMDPTGAFGGYITVSSSSSITSISAPLLTIIGNGFSAYSNTVLTTITLPLLQSIFQSRFSCNSNAALTALSLPAYVSGPGGLQCNDNPLLVSASFPLFVPGDTDDINFLNCALNAASVNQLLHRAVLNAGYLNGTIRLDGGTNAAPSGQGIADKATLIGRPGLSVSTN
jgi:hypothetical protein